MYEELRSITVHTPATLTEFGNIIVKNPHAVLWAGGTYLMSQPDYYPSTDNRDIIDLSGITELKKITRTDRYLEIGSMATVEQLADTGRLVLPPMLLQALNSIGSAVLRSQIAIGGSICVSDLRLSIPTALAAFDAVAEMRVWLKSGKSTTRWIPLSRLYDKEGKLLNQDGPFIITHIRLGLDYGSFQRFLCAGEPYLQPSESVIIAFQAAQTATSLGKVQMCITFPSKAFFINKELIGQMSGLTLPISRTQQKTLLDTLRTEMNKAYPNINRLQLMRAVRMTESIIRDINSRYLQE